MEGFHYLLSPGDPSGVAVGRRRHAGRPRAVEVRMAMPAPEADDPRWSLDLAGGALMDLGCYGLHVMRRLGHPSVVRAHAKEHSPGVDAWCDVELAFPSGATGLSANSMVADDYVVHPSHRRHQAEMSWCTTSSSRTDDDGITIRTPAGTTVEHLGTRSVIYLPTRGVRRACAQRRAATRGYRRCGGEHGVRRRRLPGGGHGSALGPGVADGLRTAFVPSQAQHQ